VNGKKVEEGEQFALGGNDSYVALCRKHFRSGMIGPSFDD
jgi:thymidine kinase